MTPSTEQSSPAHLPYDLHTHGTGAFIIFEMGDSIALPLMALTRTTIRGSTGRQLVLNFPEDQVIVEGEGLSTLLHHILLGRVRTIRVGKTNECTVSRIQAVEI